MNKKCGIYKITNIVNGKVVVGQSVDIYGRWKHYKNSLNKNNYVNYHLQQSWNKHGEENFKFEVILECPREKLNEEEIRLIKEYNATDRKFGYNMESGGNSHAHSEETRQKISNAVSGEKHPLFGKHHSEGHKAKLRMANEGENNWNYGNHLSEETKNKLSKANMGKNHPLYGTHRSEETKLKISIGQSGKKHSEEAKRKMSASHKMYWANKRANQTNL